MLVHFIRTAKILRTWMDMRIYEVEFRGADERDGRSD